MGIGRCVREDGRGTLTYNERSLAYLDQVKPIPMTKVAIVRQRAGVLGSSPTVTSAGGDWTGIGWMMGRDRRPFHTHFSHLAGHAGERVWMRSPAAGMQETPEERRKSKAGRRSARVFGQDSLSPVLSDVSNMEAAPSFPFNAMRQAGKGPDAMARAEPKCVRWRGRGWRWAGFAIGTTLRSSRNAPSTSTAQEQFQSALASSPMMTRAKATKRTGTSTETMRGNLCFSRLIPISQPGTPGQHPGVGEAR